MSRFGQYDPDPRVQRERREQGRDVYERQGPVRIAPAQPDRLGTKGPMLRLPGFNFPPAGTLPVDVIGDANIAPGGTATLVTVTVPDTFQLRVAGIGFTADDDIGLGFLTWAILLGPDPVFGYSQQLAAVGSVRQLSEIVVLADSSQTLTVRGTQSALAPITYRIICRLRGWFYTEKEGPTAGGA